MSSKNTYMHGGDIYRNRVEYDFSVNINPLGMPQESIKAAQEGVLLAGRYPDACGEELCHAIAEKEGLGLDQIILGNGAAELIFSLCYAVKPREGLVLAPAFQEYEAALTASGAKIRFWDLKEQEDFILKEEIVSVIKTETDILFLCNPNNPTGNLIDRALLELIAEKCEETGTYFCLDECFLPFLEAEAEYTMKQRLDRYPHLFILRAFTKIYGMPGLRLGYAISANRKLTDQMRGCLQPWNTSIPAQMAGIAALKDDSYLKRSRQLIKEEKKYLIDEISRGLAEKIYEPAANYIFFQSRTGLKELLLQQNILIRSCANYRNLTDDFFRIGIRTHGENMELIRRWKECTDKWQNQS